MAFFLRLSNELIILIASNIRKPSHLLQLALVNKRMHGIAIQYLYENITFHQDDYPPPSSSIHDDDTVVPLSIWEAPLTLDQKSLRDPYSNILRLSNMIGSNTLPAGHSVTRLTVVIGIDNVRRKFETLPLLLLLPQQLSSLKDYTLVYVSETPLTPIYTQLPLAPLAAALSHTSQTLQSLFIHIAPDRVDFGGGTIGSLRHFTKLHYLSIQADVLLRNPKYRLRAFDSELDLTCILPPGLKRLRLHECKRAHIQSLRALLDCFVLQKSIFLKETEKDVVHTDAMPTNQTHHPNGWLLQGSLQAVIHEAGPRGLDLEMALEWRKDYHSGGNSTNEEKLSSLLHECTQKLDEVNL